MNVLLRLIFIFTLGIFSGQDWSYASTTDVIYSYDASRYFYIDQNIELETPKPSYDGKPNPFKSVDHLQAESTDAEPLIGTSLTFIDGFFVTKGVGYLSKSGKAGTGKGVREVTGNATDARKLFDQVRGNNLVKEVKPGVFVSKGANGGNVTFRASSKSEPPTVDVHGVQKGVRKIKFLSE
jgi:hypothetical protein